MSQKCCELFLNVERECHDSHTNSILHKGEFFREKREEILVRHDKVIDAWGPKVYVFVFDKSGIPSEKCYEMLLNAGRECHDGYTNSILSEGEFSTEEKKEIMERHNEENFSGKKERKHWQGALKFGTFCKRSGKVTSACEPKVYAFVFDKSGVLSEKCCEILLTTGRECHDAAPAPIVQPLKGCAGKVTSACGPKIYEFVFDNRGILSEKCCKQLLNTGRECHNSDTNSILSEGEFSKEEREEILARHSEVWNLRKRSGHIGGTQLVPAPTVQPLTGCAGKVTSACGPKVYVFVFDKSGVLFEKCYELLLNAGRECHDGDTNSILGEGEFFAEEKKEIMERHNQKCATKGVELYGLKMIPNRRISAEEKKEIMERHNQVWNLCKKNGHIDIENTVF
ncbi:hypothetical protein Cgig2_003549 [Carnegiea gigantea]|uniref:Prolamin-like domain-containing protein n=1 Tax=Carnegiea gigantea TaxID=171969 RepID=A0A9Q1Q7E6_9CARY|nr:hypothetical protein Cgig2_003549 [Carnegiea gigantea]